METSQARLSVLCRTIGSKVSKDMFRQPLTGSIVDEKWLDEAQFCELFNFIAVWVFCTEGTSMVEVVIDPFLDVAQFTKIYDKAVVIWFFSSKGKLDRPVVSVDEGAMPAMERLPVTEWYVAVDLRTSKHFELQMDQIFQSLATISCTVGASSA